MRTAGKTIANDHSSWSNWVFQAEMLSLLSRTHENFFETFLIISGKYSSSSAALVFANGQCQVLASPNQSLTLRMAVLYYAESGSRLKQFFITKYHLG